MFDYKFIHKIHCQTGKLRKVPLRWKVLFFIYALFSNTQNKTAFTANDYHIYCNMIESLWNMALIIQSLITDTPDLFVPIILFSITQYYARATLTPLKANEREAPNCAMPPMGFVSKSTELIAFSAFSAIISASDLPVEL